MDLLAGIFLVGLLLWWIIKADLKERDDQQRYREEIAKSEARTLEAERRFAESNARDERLREACRAQSHANEKEWREKVRAAREDFEMTEREEMAIIVRRDAFVNHCIFECRQRKNADDLLTLSDVGQILGWGKYRDEVSGDIRYLHLRGGAFSGFEEVYFMPHGENPFPHVTEDGFFRATEVIGWLEEAQKQKELTLRNLEERRGRLPTEAQWNAG
jgi:hypothetical protein